MKTKEIYDFRKNYTDYKKPCVFEGYKLAVLFDEKDEIKKLGGKWNQDLKSWYITAHDAKKTLPPFEDPDGKILNLTVLEELNRRKMVVGQYGIFDDSAHHEVTMCADFEVNNYVLVSDDNRRVTFDHYPDLDVVKISDQRHDERWNNLEDAKKIWEDLTKIGGFNVLKQEEEVISH